MPNAMRQGTVDFPKRKLITRSKTDKLLEDVNRTPESKVLITPSTGSSARKAFHSSGGIIGRNEELENLTDFLKTHLNRQTSASMYISGLPGTGKTACVNYIIDRNEFDKKFHIVKINCTAFNSSKSVFKRICEDLKLKSTGKTEKEASVAIEKHLLKRHKMILLILDEIDQLETKSQSVLYKIFDWPSLKNSKFILIGIANAKDLTDRLLPRLCAKIELKPILIHFAPYTKDQIAEILKTRLIEVGAMEMFAPGSLELISAKVAGTSGDLRRALDLGKRVLDIAEQKCQRENVLEITPNKTENQTSPQKATKRKVEESPCRRTPSKVDYIVSEILERTNRSPQKNRLSSPGGPSPEKLFKSSIKSSERICLGDITPQKSDPTREGSRERPLRKSPRKVKGLDEEEDNLENTPKKFRSPGLKRSPGPKTTSRLIREEVVLRKSPRKLQFDVESKDVLSVVKTVFGSSKNFKPSEESTFPLHQKVLICTLLLIMKKGKKKNLNIGKLHQVYSKVCSKRGLTAVDKSGFLFLCRQVEVTGIVQIGKGQGTLAKISLQWDESEVADSIKDQNLLSSILDDVSCLT